MNDPANPKRASAASVLFAVAGIWMVPVGCGSVDAGPDFATTAQLIRQRTGSPDVHRPDGDGVKVDAVVATLLAEGLLPAEAVRIALLKNPQLQARFQDIGISRAELVRASLPANPTTFFSSRFPEAGGLANLTLSVTQGLLDLLLIPSRKRDRTAALEAARCAAARFAVELAGRVRQSCYEVLALRQAQQVNTEELEFAARGLGLAQRRQAAGEGDVIDVNLAKSAQLVAERGRLRIRRDLAVKQAALEELLGLGGDGPIWSLTGELPRAARVADLGTLQVLAREERLDVRIAELGVQAAATRVDLEKLQRLPDVKVGFDGERAETPPNLLGPSFELTPRLWDASRPEVARQLFALARSRRQLETTLASVARQVRQAAAAVTHDAELVTLFESRALPLARENVEAAERVYRAGQRDIIAYLATQRALFDQRTAYGKILLEYARSLAALEAAVGGRLPEVR